jgi:ferrous iron transport protein A
MMQCITRGAILQIRIALKNCRMPNRTPLSRLAPGEQGIIASVEGPEGLRQRLAALGFRAGRAVVLLRRAKFRGPLHVRLGTTEVALRPAEASVVNLRSVAPPGP